MKLASKQELDTLVSIYRSSDLVRAQSFAQRLSVRYPDDVVVLNILAVAALRNSDLYLASQAGEQAVRINPTYREAVFTLAQVYLQQNDFVRAKTLMSKWLSVNSKDAEGLRVILEATHGLAEQKEALGYCEQLLLLEPFDDRLVALKAQILQSLGRFEDALLWLDTARPNEISDTLKMIRANVLSDLDKVSDAQVLYEQLNTGMMQNSYQYLMDSANFYLEQGNFVEAKERLMKVRREHPKDPQLWMRLSKLPLDSDELETLNHDLDFILDKSDLSSVAQAHLKFAKGTIAHRLKNYEEAFLAFDAGNRVRAKQTPFYIESERAFFSKIQNAFDALSGAFSGARGGELAPIFIVGLPRSGTTLLEQILSAHSDVVSLGEVEVLNTCLQDWLSAGTKHRSISEETLSRIGHDYLELMFGRVSSASYFIDKLPLNYLWVGFIARLFPGARFIHIKKSPLAACWSLYKQEFKGYPCSYDFKALAQYYALYENHMTFWRNRVGSDQLLEIRYESFVEEPASYIRRILTFCNLPEERQVVEFKGSQQAVRTLSATQLRSGVTTVFKSEVDYYRAFLDPLIKFLAEEGIAN